MIRDRNRFWYDFGEDNPFLDYDKYWTFGDYRRRDIGFWWAIGAPRVYLLKMIVGYESKKCSSISRMQLENHSSMKMYNIEALATLEEYISLGILKIIPERYAKVILPMSVIVKPGKVRVVVDGKPINIYTPAMKFRPNSVVDVKNTIFPSARALTQDAMHAFFQLKVTPEQALYQCVKFYYPPMKKEIVCCFTTEFFGGKLSCYRYKKQDDIINNFFRLNGIQLNDFYDDAIFYSQDHKLQIAVLGSFIKRIYYGCGRLLKEAKTDLLIGKYTFPFCGFEWNSKLMKHRPLEKLIISTHQAIDYLIENQGKFVYIKLLVKVIGKLVYAGLVIHTISILLSPLKEIMRTLHRRYGQEEIWHKKLKITSYLVDHLLYLKSFIHNNHVEPIVINSWDIEIVTDVSDKMAGSHDSTGKIFSIPLAQDIANESSTLRETYGIYLALENRLQFIKNKTVRVLIDNLGTSTIVMRNGSKINKLNQIVYRIIRLCVDNSIKLWVRWLRRDTEAIQFADDLSKCVEADRWLFDRNILSFIIQTLKLKTITLDLLADYNNKICDKYYSRYFDGRSLGYNWMKQQHYCFSGYQCYLNPPFRNDYLALSIQQIINKKIDTYILLPRWTSASWYSQVLQHAALIIEFPDGETFFESPSYMTLRLTKKWRLLFVSFVFTSQVTPRYYRFVSRTMTFLPVGALRT